MNIKKGMVHIYYGKGKGKTTAAIGLLIRALGNNVPVAFFQFIKSKNSGELAILKKLNIDIYRPNPVENKRGYISSKPTEEDIERAEKILELAIKAINSKRYQLVVLDEALVATSLGLFSIERLVELIKGKPKEVEIVITGRGRPGMLSELADYITEMNEVKHPYYKGIEARRGIEF